MCASMKLRGTEEFSYRAQYGDAACLLSVGLKFCLEVNCLRGTTKIGVI